MGRHRAEADDGRRVGQRPGRDPDRPLDAADLQRRRRARGPHAVPRRSPGARRRQLPGGGLRGQPQSEGKVTSVPWVADTRILFYRTDIFSEVGLAGPPTTWAEFTAAAEKLAARGGSNYGYYIPQWDAPLPIEFTWQAGGDVVDADGKINLDTPEFRRAVDFYLSFFEKKLVPTASDFDQGAGFISGAAPMLISGPYLAAGIKDQAPGARGQVGRHDDAQGRHGDRPVRRVEHGRVEGLGQHPRRARAARLPRGSRDPGRLVRSHQPSCPRTWRPPPTRRSPLTRTSRSTPRSSRTRRSCRSSPSGTRWTPRS